MLRAKFSWRVTPDSCPSYRPPLLSSRETQVLCLVVSREFRIRSVSETSPVVLRRFLLVLVFLAPRVLQIPRATIPVVAGRLRGRLHVPRFPGGLFREYLGAVVGVVVGWVGTFFFFRASEKIILGLFGGEMSETTSKR